MLVGLVHDCRVNPMKKYFLIGLQLLGTLTLIVLLAIVCWFTYIKLINKTNRPGEFILHRAGISSAQQWNLQEHGISERSFSGDHTDYYCIQLEQFEVIGAFQREAWRPAPESEKLFNDALVSALEWASIENAKCIPSLRQINDAKMQVLFEQVTLRSRQVTAAQIIVADPVTKTLFYISFKT